MSQIDSIVEKEVERLTQPLENKAEFTPKLEAHLAQLVEIYGPKIVQYGTQFRLSLSALRTRRALFKQYESREGLDSCLALFDPDEYVALQKALVTGAIENSEFNEQDAATLAQYQQGSRFAMPFEIARTQVESRHQGDVSGCYDVTLYVPGKDGTNHEFRSFIKVFKDKKSFEKSLRFDLALHEAGANVPEVLYHNRTSKLGVIMYEHCDNALLKQDFAGKMGRM